MTKSQSTQAFNTASGENTTAGNNAQTTYNTAQQDINSYQNDLAEATAQNPFVTGGSYQTAQNQSLASTAAAGTQAAQQAAQAAAVRSGMNPNAAIAAGTSAEEANTRQQLQDVAQANQSRISQGSSYSQDLLGDQAKAAGMEGQLNQQELGAQDSTLNAETSSSKTPSFWQELGQGVISSGEAFAGGAGKALGCWIAARLFGGWNAREVALLRLYFTYGVTGRFGRAALWLYGKGGRWIAEWAMPRSSRLSFALAAVFDEALVAAIRWTRTERGAAILQAYDRLRLVDGYTVDAPAPDKSWLDMAIQQAGKGR